MKALFLVVILAVSPVFASHFFTATADVKVVAVQSLARMDGSAIFSGDLKLKDHEQTVTVQIVKVVSSDSPHGNPGLKVGQKVTLNVRKEQVDQFKKGDLLTLDYRNVGDARASRISWDIVK